jgi:hypothetical protein
MTTLQQTGLLGCNAVWQIRTDVSKESIVSIWRENGMVGRSMSNLSLANGDAIIWVIVYRTTEWEHPLSNSKKTCHPYTGQDTTYTITLPPSLKRKQNITSLTYRKPPCNTGRSMIEETWQAAWIWHNISHTLLLLTADSSYVHKELKKQRRLLENPLYSTIQHHILVVHAKISGEIFNWVITFTFYEYS